MRSKAERIEAKEAKEKAKAQAKATREADAEAKQAAAAQAVAADAVAEAAADSAASVFISALCALQMATAVAPLFAMSVTEKVPVMQSEKPVLRPQRGPAAEAMRGIIQDFVQMARSMMMMAHTVGWEFEEAAWTAAAQAAEQIVTIWEASGASVDAMEMAQTHAKRAKRVFADTQEAESDASEAVQAALEAVDQAVLVVKSVAESWRCASGTAKYGMDWIRRKMPLHYEDADAEAVAVSAWANAVLFSLSAPGAPSEWQLEKIAERRACREVFVGPGEAEFAWAKASMTADTLEAWIANDVSAVLDAITQLLNAIEKLGTLLSATTAWTADAEANVTNAIAEVRQASDAMGERTEKAAPQPFTLYVEGIQSYLD